MELHDIQTQNERVLQFKLLDDERIAKRGIGILQPSPEPNVYHWIEDGKLIRVGLFEGDQASQNYLEMKFRTRTASLGEVISTKDTFALIRIVFFNGPLLEMGNVDIGIENDNGKFTKAAQRVELPSDMSNLCKTLVREGTLTVGNDTYFVILTGPASYTDFESQTNPNDKDSFPIAEDLRGFTYCGSHFRVPVARKRITEEDEVFLATKLIGGDGTSDVDPAYRLCRGNITFTSNILKARIQSLAADNLQRLGNGKKRFIQHWYEYASLQGDMLLKRARIIGKIKIITPCHPDRDENTIRFSCLEIPNELREGDSLELLEQLPPYLLDPKMTWHEYYKSSREKNKSTTSRRSPRQPCGKIKKLNSSNHFIELQYEEDLPKVRPTMFLVLSILGDETQIKRREQAKQKLLEGRSANPELCALIDGDPSDERMRQLRQFVTPAFRTIPALPEDPDLARSFQDKVFKGYPPRSSQLNAIKMALNTPDIALIQGPPGTGKTTVIAAIIERLNHESDKRRSNRGSLLITGYQHDAIENLANRVTINSLPTLKIERKSRSSNSQEYSERKIREWKSHLLKNLEGSGEFQQFRDRRAFRSAHIRYEECPSSANIRRLLKRIVKLGVPEYKAQAMEILRNLDAGDEPIDSSLLLAVRSLRITEAGFLDDGPQNAANLLVHLEKFFEQDDSHRTILETAAKWKPGSSLEFLPTLACVKREWLERCLPKVQYSVAKPREDIGVLVRKVRESLKKRQNESDGVNEILARFYDELENNPEEVTRAVQEYQFAFATTAQQSAGFRTREIKTVDLDPGSDYFFETVVVEEAARTPPLDLLIPMTFASKRIILVGDHRQLPHIVENEIVNQIIAGENAEKIEREFYEKSLFEHLIALMRQKSLEDGISRVITLQEQFRMHPILGDFVSRNFYENQEDGVAISSPLQDVRHFKHDLPGSDERPAIWHDIPVENGKPQRVGTSYCRIPEARFIAEKLKQWMDCEKGTNLNFGVISFYGAQVDAIKRELAHFGITEKKGSEYEITKQYAHFSSDDRRERLRIGTVDSFQGMEFDVVFLSVVRSEPPPSLTDSGQNADDELRKYRGIFGFLVSKNRLCVAMSRQKRLLVVVGDGKLVVSPLGRAAVPGLAAFYDLCRELEKEKKQ